MKNIKIAMRIFILALVVNNSLLAMFTERIAKQKNYKQRLYDVLRQKYPYINYTDVTKSLYEGSKVSFTAYFDSAALKKNQIYLIPTDQSILKKLDFFPLFTRKESVILDSELINEMTSELRQQNISEEDIKRQLASLGTGVGPEYHLFKEGMFEKHEVDVNVPGVIFLGSFGPLQRTLMQLKSLDQFELADQTGLSPALCAGHALHSSKLIHKYALTNETHYLKWLHDIDKAASFLRDLAIEDWLNVEIVRKNIKRVSKELGADGVDISAVSTVTLFDSELNKKAGFEVFDQAEFEYVQGVLKNIKDGLKQEYYVHLIIVGNEEVAASHGHYFAFAIIKAKNEVQYVVLDTLPNVYHLQEGSHERDRLMFVIDTIEKGASSVNLTNLRMQSSFLESKGHVSEESKIENMLSQERMESVGDFKEQITLLNNFSKALNQFGVQKQLSKESQESLSQYSEVIHKMAEVWGQKCVYPTMKLLITQELVKRRS